MAFETFAQAGLDYGRCTYGTSRLVFRGPPTEEPAEIAVLGGTATFGKFVSRPYPALLEQALGRRVVNLGAMNAGLEAFAGDPVLDEVVARARLAVVQVPGAESASNRFYGVHRRRNDRVVAASRDLRALFPGLELGDATFVRHFLARLHDDSPVRFARVVDELRRSWVVRMRRALARIPVPVLLLWISDRAPAGAGGTPVDPRDGDPLFVTRAMLDEVAGETAGLVEVVHPMAGVADLAEMTFAELDRPAALAVPSPRGHQAVARALAQAVVPHLIPA